MSIKLNYDHELIYKTFIDSDIKNWKEEIEIINMEMIFYKNLIQKHLSEYATWGQFNYKSLLQGIVDIQYYNEISQRNFIKYNNVIHGIAECQDLQCESYFLNVHSKLKQVIEKHFSTSKQFKKTIISYLKTRYNY